MNIYREILRQNLPRLISLYNLDPCSATYGYADRLYWGWKISDFPNGTLQGGVHALSIAFRLGLIADKEFAFQTIDAAIKAVGRIRAKNGSMVESYPGENSFCVTALVSFDVLSAIHHLQNHLRDEHKQRYLEIIRPLVSFISRYDEEHAIISNHLATAVAAVLLWKRLSGEDSTRDTTLLDLIFQNQSQEGWFKEYEGADPGYQTLCTYYLFCVYENIRDEKLLARLQKSAGFLKYFIHPDGTIGGLYGSRNTEVYYPGGIVGLAPFSDDFTLIARCLQEAIENECHILPQTIDIGNFVPLLNSYAVAALHYDRCRRRIKEFQAAPPYLTLFDKNFKKAGIYIRSNLKFYAIINYKKGGTIKAFDKIARKIDIEDGGLFGRQENGLGFSTQQFDPKLRFKDFTIKANFYSINEKYPTPLANMLLRLLGLTIFRSVAFGNIFKKFIVHILITRKNKIGGHAIRKFEFRDDRIIIHERLIPPQRCAHVGHFGKWTAIHMASSGYYLKQIEQVPEPSEFVEFKISTDSDSQNNVPKSTRIRWRG